MNVRANRASPAGRAAATQKVVAIFIDAAYIYSMPRAKTKQRFALGARVVVGMSGQVGTVLQVDDKPRIMGEYVHTFRTKNGDRKIVGCDLELVP